MTTAADIRLDNLDLFEAAPPWAVFDELRANDPVHWDAEDAPNHGFWSITRYQDIVNVLRDAMAVDNLQDCGVYFGTTGGELWASTNEGAKWSCIARHLPEIYAVEAALL